LSSGAGASSLVRMPVAALERPLPPSSRAAVRAACGPVEVIPLARGGDDLQAVLPLRNLAPLDPHASATAFILARALSRLGAVEHRRIVDGWRSHRSRSDAPLVIDEGCDVCIARTRVGEGARVALLAWLPLAAAELAVFEGGLLREAPADAVALLVRPPLIWSLHEALLAGMRVPRHARFDPGWFTALEQGAQARVRPRHLHRLRRAAARIEAQLPSEAFPVASASVAAGCAVIAGDDAACSEIAARQLARYAVSEVARGLADSYTC
jgi:hypothetical protein